MQAASAFGGFFCVIVPGLAVLVGIVALVISHIKRGEWWRAGLWALMPGCGVLTIGAGAAPTLLAIPLALAGIGIATAGLVIESRVTKQIKAEAGQSKK
jgi:hypothetical protein